MTINSDITFGGGGQIGSDAIGASQGASSPSSANDPGQSSIGPSSQVGGEETTDPNSPKLKKAMLVLILLEMSGFMQFSLSAPTFDQNGSGMTGKIDFNPKANAAALTMNFLEMQSRVTSNMWNAFMDGIREAAEQREELRKSPAYLDWLASQKPTDLKAMTNSSPAQFESLIKSLSPESRDRQFAMLSNTEKADQWIISAQLAISAAGNVNNSELASNANPGAANLDLKTVVMASLVIGSSGITDYVRTADDPSTRLVATKVVQDGLNALPQQSTQFIPPDLGIFGALLVNGLINRATGEAAINNMAKQEKPTDKAAAESYAQKIINLVKGDGLNSFMLAILTHNLEGVDTPAPEKMHEYTAIIKLVLLSSALALLYTLETKKIIETDFEGMVNFLGKEDGPEIKFAEGDIRHTLVAMIKEQLSYIADPALRQGIIEALFTYMATNPNIKELMTPNKVLTKTFEGMPSLDLESQAVTVA